MFYFSYKVPKIPDVWCYFSVGFFRSFVLWGGFLWTNPVPVTTSTCCTTSQHPLSCSRWLYYYEAGHQLLHPFAKPCPFAYCNVLVQDALHFQDGWLLFLALLLWVRLDSLSVSYLSMWGSDVLLKLTEQNKLRKRWCLHVAEMMHHPKPVGSEQLWPLHLRKYLADVSAVLWLLWRTGDAWLCMTDALHASRNLLWYKTVLRFQISQKTVLRSMLKESLI